MLVAVQTASKGQPMKFLVLAAVIATAPVAAQLDGSFTLRSNDRDDRVNLNLEYDGNSNYGRTLERSALSDVSRTGDRITFTMRRDPGTFRFEGRGSLDRATGWYEFQPNASFRQEMERLGLRDVDGKALFVFALDDLTVAQVKQLKTLVSNELDTSELVRLLNHGAGVRYIQEMSDAGFKKLTSGEYRRARDHGVSADFAREMADLGMALSLDELTRTRDHGVTTEYVRAMRAAGFKVDLQELVRARDHGISVDGLRRMRELGYRDLPLEEYIRMRDHGVTVDYIQAMNAEGYKNLSPGELVRLRDHGVSASYVRRIKEMLKETPSVEQIIRLRSGGDITSRRP